MTETVKIQNLKCGGCAHTIKTKLEGLDDISNVVVVNNTDEVHFDYSEASQIATVVELLSKLGYPVEGASNPITKKAKSFVSCAIGKVNS